MALLKQTVRKSPHTNILQENFQTFIVHQHDLDTTDILHLPSAPRSATPHTTDATSPTNSSTATSTPIYELGKHLLNAAKNGNISEIKSLMGRGAAFTPDWLGSCPLHYAASNGHVQACEVLLRAGISRNSRTKVERTPLHMAVYEGHMDVVETLIKHGADVNARDMLQMTPLQWAVQRCQPADDDLAMVRCLLKYGAKAKTRNKFGNTALDIAQQLAHGELIELIQKAAEAEQQLHHATDSDEAELLQYCDKQIEVDKGGEQVSIDQARQVDEYLNDVVELPTAKQQVVTIEDCVDDDVQQNLELGEEHSIDAPYSNKMLIDNGYCSSTSVDQTNGNVASTQNVDLPKNREDAAAVDQEEDPYRLLRQRYGIELLPEMEEDGGRILKQAMDSGHTVSLTEAGKRALKAFKLQDEQQQQVTTATNQLKKQMPPMLQLINGPAKAVPTIMNFGKLQKQKQLFVEATADTSKRKRVFSIASASRENTPQIVFLQNNNNNNRTNSKMVARVAPSATKQVHELTAVPSDVAALQRPRLQRQRPPPETTLLTLTTDEFAGLQANGGFVRTNNGVYRIMHYNQSPGTTAVAGDTIRPKRVRGTNGIAIGDNRIGTQPEARLQESETVEALRHQLQEQRHLVDVYKRKYLKKEAEAERFKQQLKLMLKHRSSNRNLNADAICTNNENNSSNNNR